MISEVKSKYVGWFIQTTEDRDLYKTSKEGYSDSKETGPTGNLVQMLS